MGLGFQESFHLLARTGFGVEYADLISLQKFSRTEAVDLLLGEIHQKPRSRLPAFVLENVHPDKKDKDAIRMQVEELKSWWSNEMRSTDSQLTEMLVLFWHNHFTSSLEKVRFPVLLFRQQELFRLEAGGSFANLLKNIWQDPAMILYLDTQSNRKGAPNENFARELLELFTLGVGNYTEQDIREAARAFTGYQVDKATGKVTFKPKRHDAGQKTFLGQSGPFLGADIIRIILENKKTALFITRKLSLCFMARLPAAEVIAEWANEFYQSGYQMRPLLRRILPSEAFLAECNQGTLIKSPVDFVIGSLRSFRELEIEDAVVTNLLKRLGQDLFNPPNVRGWPGGREWISTTTLMLRKQAIEKAFRGMDKEIQANTVWASGAAEIKGMASILLTDPRYQVK